MKATGKRVGAAAVAALLAGCSSPGTSGMGPPGHGPGLVAGDAAGDDANAGGGSSGASSGGGDGGGAAHDSSLDGPGDGASQVDGASQFDGASQGDAGAGAADASVDRAPLPPPTPGCDPAATWGAGVLLAVSTAGDDELVSVTPDEHTIAWVVTQGASRTIEYADGAGGSFGAPQILDATPFANERAALSPDGLRLVVVNADGQGFSELTRSAGGSFGAPSAGAFSNLNAPGALGAGESYGDPILSSDDRTFYYSRYGGGRTQTIFQTGRLFSGDSWSVATTPASSATQLMGQAGADAGVLRRRPTGISADEQTLFYWDEVTSTEHAAWVGSSGDFETFAVLGSRSGAEPNLGCTALYHSAGGASSVDLFKSTRN